MTRTTMQAEGGVLAQANQAGQVHKQFDPDPNYVRPHDPDPGHVRALTHYSSMLQELQGQK
ncbi:hypothetical protein [Janthinobacterium sp. LB2P10]|uniref:hypothetical protein n=1 Tax=Janthinobacterium sp. LB2P10 TaxID=3424194 RepID=UPI003F238679